MREIKFRFWDTVYKKFVPSEFLELNWDGEVIAVYDRRVDVDNLDNNKDVIAMQYIGLKDRNGKEIYQGDIFKIENHWPVYVVVYAEEAATFGLQSRGGPFKPFTTVLRDMKDYSLSEVLGNIHENPELLEVAADV